MRTFVVMAGIAGAGMIGAALLAPAPASAQNQTYGYDRGAFDHPGGRDWGYGRNPAPGNTYGNYRGRGYNPGYNYGRGGYNPGYNDGRGGYNLGYNEGYSRGYNPGYNPRYNPGYNPGYNYGPDYGRRGGNDYGWRGGYNPGYGYGSNEDGWSGWGWNPGDGDRQYGSGYGTTDDGWFD